MRLIVIGLLLGLAHSAAADTRAKLFPLSSSGLPKSLKSAPAELSRVLSRSLGAELATVSIDDAADMLECLLTQAPCLEAITRSVGVPTIIFGKLVMRDDKATLELTQFETGKDEVQREFSLTGDDTDAMVASLRDALDNAGKKRPVPVPVPVATPAESSGPTTGTYGLIIGGGVAAGIGIALVVSANTVRGQVDHAPTTTRDDIDRLIALEKVGKTRMQAGGALLAVGGVVATIGIIRMVVQKRSSAEKPMLDMVPEKGGASVVLTLGWR